MSSTTITKVVFVHLSQSEEGAWDTYRKIYIDLSNYSRENQVGSTTIHTLYSSFNNLVVQRVLNVLNNIEYDPAYLSAKRITITVMAIRVPGRPATRWFVGTGPITHDGYTDLNYPRHYISSLIDYSDFPFISVMANTTLGDGLVFQGHFSSAARTLERQAGSK